MEVETSLIQWPEPYQPNSLVLRHNHNQLFSTDIAVPGGMHCSWGAVTEASARYSNICYCTLELHCPYISAAKLVRNEPWVAQSDLQEQCIQFYKIIFYLQHFPKVLFITMWKLQKTSWLIPNAMWDISPRSNESCCHPLCLPPSSHKYLPDFNFPVRIWKPLV